MEETILENTVIENRKEVRRTAGEGLLEKRTLQDLNLLDDFLFNAVVSYPEIGERFSRKLLGIIFQREFGELTVIPQKVYYGSNLGKHGARLDVYLEADGAGVEPGVPAVLYDLEVDGNDSKKHMEALPRRVRFYHSKLDTGSLKSGTDYRELKDVVVVMIMPYDPFQRNRMVYTVRNTCVEEPGMPYDDGAKTLFLYTRGTEGDAPEELKKLMKYMEETSRENAVTSTLEEMHGMVEQVKQDGEVLLGYMKIFEREAMLVEMAQEREKENTERERQRADAAETRAEVERNRANEAESQAEMERNRASAAESQAEMERSRANEAEEQVRLLKEELEKLKKSMIT